MTSVDWHLADSIINILRRDVGRTDDELMTMLRCDRKELSRAIGVLYRQGKVDRCWQWIVLPPMRGTR